MRRASNLFPSPKPMYAFGMPLKKICLKAVMGSRDGKSIWTGEYACSICGLRFHPDPTDPAKLSHEFETHKDQHLADATGKE
jgi:hypothetical protein